MADLLEELNRDVWYPFVAAYRDLDPAAVTVLNTPDLIRAGGPALEVHGLAEHGRRMHGFLGGMAGRGDRLAIEFRFTERLAAADLASERGFFRITVDPAEGDQRIMYYYFHVFSRRADGRWRMAVDYDTVEGASAELFEAAAKIDDLAAFGR
jgi:ketosteroid isomerase-like protein